MGYLAQFLGRFSESFAAAVALWPLASLLLTLPILAYLYHRDGRLRATSAVSAYLAVLYVLGLGCFTLYPLPDGTSGPGITYGIEPRFNPLGFLDDLAKDGVRALPDMVANVAFFVPLGFIAGRLLRWRFAMTLAAGFGTSLLIETAQLTGLFGLYPYAYRMFDVLDLFCNTAGAAVGWGAAVLAGRLLPPGELAREGRVTDRPGFVRRAVAFWIDLSVMGGRPGRPACRGERRAACGGRFLVDRRQLVGACGCGCGVRRVRGRCPVASAGPHARRRLRAHDVRDAPSRRLAAARLLRGAGAYAGRRRSALAARGFGAAAVLRLHPPHALRLPVTGDNFTCEDAFF